MNSPILSLEHVYVSRGSAPVLHDIHLTLAAGEHLAILGPNGCGKSTLLKTITCELYPLAVAPDGAPTSVRIFGRQRWDLTELRRRLGVVSPDLPGKPTLHTTGLDVILTGFFSASTLWPNLTVTDSMRRRAEDLLHQVGAASLRHKPVGEMSAGQQRRIMIARALAGSQCAISPAPSSRPEAPHTLSSQPEPPNSLSSRPERSEVEGTASLPMHPLAAHTSGAPSSSAASPPKRVGSSSGTAQEQPTNPQTQMLLLDEPSNALDLAAQHDLRSLLRDLAQAGTTILLITHQTADIIPEIGRVLLMRDGRIVADGPTRDLLTAPRLSDLFGLPIELTERNGFLHTW